MKMYKTVPTLVLLFTEGTVRGPPPSLEKLTSDVTASSTPGVREAPKSETTSQNHLAPPPAAKGHSATIVAVLSISFVLLCICVITGVSCAQKLSKRSSVEINPAPAPSSEVVVTLENIKT